MAVDTSIFNHLLRAPKSIAEYDAEAMANQQNKLALQASRMQMEDRQRGVEQENKLADVYRSAVGVDGTTDRNRLYTEAAAQGLGARLPGIQKGYADLDETAAKTSKEQRLAEKAKFEMARGEIEFINQVISSATDQNSYTQGRQAMAARGMDVSQIPEQFDPEYVAAAGQQTMTELQRIEQGWKERGFDLEVQKFGYQQKNDMANRNVTIRGQDSAAAGRAQSERHFNVNQAASGKPPSGYRFKADGSMEAIPGGPADLKNGAEAVKKVSEAKDVLSLLDEADALLPKGTSGLIGTGVDEVLGAGGLSTAGGQATAQLKAIEGALISKMPKMSGPQSDKDVLLYKQMAGQVGDSTIPREQRQAASKLIRKLNEKYAGMPEGSSKPAAGAFADAEKERRYQEFKAKQSQGK